MAPVMDVAWERWVARRDPQALNQVVHDSAGMVYATCLRILGNPTEAEDVAQECYEALLREKDAARVRVVGAWLHGAATYRSLTRLRAEDRRARREAQYAAEQPAQVEPARNELNQCVDEALAELPEDLRIALVQTFLCGRTQREVAKQLGIPRRTLRHRIDTGLEQLGQFLRQRGVAVEVTALAAVLAAATAQASQVPASLTTSLGKLVLSQSVGTAAPMVAVEGGGAKGAWLAVGLLVALSALGGVAWQSASKMPTVPQDKAKTTVVPLPESAPPARPSDNLAQSLLTWLKSAPPQTETAPKATVKVSGYVVDEDGAPVNDVRVGLKHKLTFGVGTGASVSVNEKGEFVCTEFEGGPLVATQYDFFYCSKTLADAVPPTTNDMEIQVVEAPPINITPAMLEEGREITNVRVVVPSAKRAVRGTVRDEKGQPIAGAKLGMFNGMANAETLSGGDGAFALTRIRPNGIPMSVSLLKSLHETHFPLRVDHPDYEPLSMGVVVGNDGVGIKLHERRRGRISGTVMDARTNKPIPVSKVWVGEVVTDYGEKRLVSMLGSADMCIAGRFVRNDIPAGVATLWASAKGYGMARVSPVQVRGNEETADIKILLEPEGVVQVRPNLAAYPPRGTKINYVCAYKEGEDSGDSYEAEKQEDGTYRLGLVPGRYEVIMSVHTLWDKENSRSASICHGAVVELLMGETSTVEIGAPGGAIVQGTTPTLSDGQILMFALRKGVQEAALGKGYAESIYRVGNGPLDFHRDGVIMYGWGGGMGMDGQYNVNHLPAGTLTLTALLYDAGTGQIRQQSEVFTVGDGETTTVDFEF